MKPVNTKDGDSFLIQALIFIAPALITTLLFNINDAFTLIQEFALYRCGISGLFLIGFFSIFFMPIDESIAVDIASILVLLIYFLIFRYFYKTRFNNRRKTKLIFTCTNITLAVWGILSGGFVMLISHF